VAEVNLSSVRKVYGAFEAVHKLDLSVQDREFVVLVGPSGCGKSTTLRMVAGLEEVTSGAIQIGGRRVDHLPPKDRDIAMVFQNYALYQHMTVYDNLAFGLRNRKVNEADIRKKIDAVVATLGIGSLLGRKPRQLSGGQQQRVALGRCMVRDPQVFLYDEPLSNLDAKLRAQMRLELKRLRQEVGTTSIYVTHDQVEAMTLGDRVVVMRDGYIQQAATPLEVYDRPRNRFVAGFLGAPSMNFLDVDLVEAGDRLLAQAEGLTVAVPDQQASVLRRHNARQVALGIRPEHITLSGRESANGAELNGLVEVTEQLGAELLAGVRVGSALIMVSRIDPTEPIEPRQPVRLLFQPHRLHFFDKQTDEAIR
jgi:multiple sugar transport system ATP-binding protein